MSAKVRNLNLVFTQLLYLKSDVFNAKKSGLLFGLKVAVAAGTIYYLKKSGVWNESEETTKLYGRIKETTKPFVQQVTSNIPIEIPDLPSSQKTSFLMKNYWNAGVTKTFTFLGELPEHVCDWTSKGMSAVANNKEVKNFVNSIKQEPVPSVPQK